jgi:excisionase family DNA binding protein
MKENLTHDTLPEGVTIVLQKVNEVIRLLNEKQEPPEQPEKLLTIKGAAEFLSLSVPTLYSKTAKGIIPFMKKGKRLYFSKAELLDFIKTGRKKTNSEIAAEAMDYLSNNKKG